MGQYAWVVLADREGTVSCPVKTYDVFVGKQNCYSVYVGTASNKDIAHGVAKEINKQVALLNRRKLRALD